MEHLMRHARIVRFAMLAAGSLALTPAIAVTRPPSAANTSPTYDASHRVFRLDAGGVTYAMGVDSEGKLQTLYWGARLASGDPLGPAMPAPERSSFDPAGSLSPQEYAGWGGAMTATPALKIRLADGNRDLVLRYDSYTIESGGLSILLRDAQVGVAVSLRYTADTATGIIGRSAHIENTGKQALVVDSAASAAWNLPRGSDYSLRYLTGTWAGEWHLQTRAITPGATVLESRRGSTGDENNPWFAIGRGNAWSETHGDVWFGALAWSGSWSIRVDEDILGQVRVVGGYNPFDFGYKLSPGQALDTPVFYAGYTRDGMGEASRLLHRFERDRILPEGSKTPLRPVLYNSWEATEFKVDEPGQVRLAEKAAALGVERFVMDDGWFGARNTDRAGLGDWVVNRNKFPNGLKPLIDKVHGLGMSFGLWVEPEMINADSDLYRAHPDWVLNFPGRDRSEGRHQMVLNLAREDVKAHVLEVLDGLLKDNDIQFLKWDYNRNWSEPGWPQMSPDEQQKVYVAYVDNLYDIIRELRKRHPKVEIESCSGGGARVDLGIMALTDEVWPSDNTDPSDRLSIQDGFSQAYAPATMMAWVTGSPNWVNNRTSSLDFRFLSSMQGGLGIGANLLEWTAADEATARHYITEYKAIRGTVQKGDLYRLLSPQDRAPWSATESVAGDGSQAVLFAFQRQGEEARPFPTLRLRGLEPAARYRFRSIHGTVAPGTPEVASGAYWMEHGVNVLMRGDLQAAGLVFERDGKR
ncbi:alpha-galactosidase [Xanthomonas hyacinthi DSM 19077]|nr:alpha-galactosidase [Luteibacter rhizovicinus DSM 16549]KLD74201.1 alpha-galactosidase [Xanthomonas hyacinthi DSM 19077]